MYLILTFAGLTIALLVIGYLIDEFSYEYDGGALKCLGWIMCAITIISIILVPICRYWSTGRIVEYKTRQATIEQQRKNNISEIERATLTKEIIEDNAWLSSCEYDVNNKWFNVYYDKNVLDLEPIE
jgi:hypothetical protein